jgi:TatD DNase family protein
VIDSHCHLAGEAFEADLVEVVARARAAGVTRLMCILAAGDAREARQALELVRLWPEVRLAVGVHPHQAAICAGRPGEASRLVRDAVETNPAVRAVGEIGLDYHYDFAPRDVQRDVFREQVRLARDLDLPVVIHTREAEADTLQVLREERGGRGIFHCFTGDAALAAAALDLGFHISFAGIVTFPKAQSLRDIAATVPEDRLLVETDSPYLAPVPFRGTRNEPAFVARVVETIAGVRGVEPAALGASLARTFDALTAR